MSPLLLVRLGALILGLGVASGAFAAHGLKEVLTPYGHEIWQKAVFYQMVHGLALLALAPLRERQILTDRTISIAGWLFLLGIALFSGSLYVLALSEQTWLGAITPFGGVSFLIGWGVLGASKQAS